jgi:hypothetical protein
MRGKRSSETSVPTIATRRHIPENGILHVSNDVTQPDDPSISEMFPPIFCAGTEISPVVLYKTDTHFNYTCFDIGVNAASCNTDRISICVIKDEAEVDPFLL